MTHSVKKSVTDPALYYRWMWWFFSDNIFLNVWWFYVFVSEKSTKFCTEIFLELWSCARKTTWPSSWWIYSTTSGRPLCCSYSSDSKQILRVHNYKEDPVAIYMKNTVVVLLMMNLFHYIKKATQLYIF